MKKVPLYVLCVAILLLAASGAGAFLIDLNSGRGANIPHDQTIFIEFREAIQTIASSAAGVFDPFQYDYKPWKRSGQKMDTAFMLPTSLLGGDSLYEQVNLYTQFGILGDLSFPSQAGFEEDAPRAPGTPFPEPATMLLLGIGLVGLSALGRKGFKSPVEDL
jgi:hypothetical protein